MSLDTYTIGLDFGTNSVRALLVDTRTGRSVASHVHVYAHGTAGIVTEPSQPDLARQHPSDYLTGLTAAIRAVLEAAGRSGIAADRVVGIGVDTTGSTPMPIDAEGRSLAAEDGFDPDTLAWLWKDHTAHAEAEEITRSAARHHPDYLAKCGGRYSSEWFWAKLLRLARVNPDVAARTVSWVEIADWIPAVLTGNTRPDRLVRGICAAGHKAFYNPQWGGYPDPDWLASLHPVLKRVRETLTQAAVPVGVPAGALTADWASRLGLAEGTPVSVGAFDAHLGAIGAGITDGTLVKVIGTSTCDIMVAPLTDAIQDVPGVCGIVPESVLPGYIGIEAGQSAVGDIYNWFVNIIEPGGPDKGSHASLTDAAAALRPGQSGLLTLDWHNGNRTVLVDQRLTGLTIGLTLHTGPAEIYRSLLESSAFGARVIVERIEDYGVPVRQVIATGGVSARNPLAMQIYADVLNRPVTISPELQTCALGAAIAAAVAAGPERGGHAGFDEAMAAMSDAKGQTFTPDPAAVAVYEGLYQLFKALHDSFGVEGSRQDLSGVMKSLLDIRDHSIAA